MLPYVLHELKEKKRISTENLVETCVLNYPSTKQLYLPNTPCYRWLQPTAAAAPVTTDRSSSQQRGSPGVSDRWVRHPAAAGGGGAATTGGDRRE